MKKPLKKYKSIFISDAHLGCKHSQSELLNNFLKYHFCENLFLVGDIIDGWELHRSFRWKHSDSLVLRQIINKSRHGARIYYITGNHDEFLRDWIEMGMEFEGVKLCNELVYEAINGKRYLIVHGDLFDGVNRVGKWVSLLGNSAYNFAFSLNGTINWVRKTLNLEPWSFADFCKRRVKQAIVFIGNFEHHLSSYAKEQECEGVICGHIHHQTDKQINDMHYLNCGDWMESCSAIGENYDGSFELIKWTKLHVEVDPQD